MWIDIFKAGRHTDSKGRTNEFTHDDLDGIVASYSAGEHEAPVVIGHPKDDSPAWGWVEGLRRSGNILQAKLKELAPEFVEWVKEGRYKKRSISLYPDETLRHVGFLGAMPPAVKGLTDASFSASFGEGEYSEYEYMDGEAVAGLWQRLREWMIEKFGKEDADKIVSSYDIDYLKTIKDGDQGSGEMVPGFSDPRFPATEKSTKQKEEPVMPDKKTYTEEELNEALGMQKREFAEKEKGLKDQLKTKDAELAGNRRESRQAEFKSFCETLKKEGKLTPAEEKMGIVDFMEALEDQEPTEIEFAEGEKKSPAQWFKDYLSNRGKVIEFREIAGGGKALPATDEATREKLISDYRETNECDYKTAMIAVSTENPELFQ